MQQGGNAQPTREHLVPQAHGGTDRHIIVVCQRDNEDKAALTLDQFLARLHRTGDRRARHVEAWMAANYALVAECRALAPSSGSSGSGGVEDAHVSASIMR